MSRNDISIKGLDKLTERLGALPEHVDAAARRAVRAEVVDVAQDMRANAPIKDGDLRAGIQAEYDDATLTGTAASTARHSQFVVHGTSDTPANDFMTPAANRSRRRFRRRVITEVNKELEGLGRG